MKPKQKLTNVNSRIAGTTRPMYHGKTPDQVGEHIAEVAVKAFTTFGEHVREVRKEYEWLQQYFRHKPKDERVCGCLTFKDYCENVLGKSYQAMYYALNPEKRSASKPKLLPPAPEPSGSASYVNPSHPDYAKMVERGLIKTEQFEEAESEVKEADVAERVTIKRKDGSIIPEATYAVEDAVRHSIAFVQSTYQFLSATEKAQVIDKVIEKLLSERDFILKETTIVVIDEAEETKPEPTKPNKGVQQIYDTSIKPGTVVTLDYGDRKQTALFRSWMEYKTKPWRPIVSFCSKKTSDWLKSEVFVAPKAMTPAMQVAALDDVAMQEEMGKASDASAYEASP